MVVALKSILKRNILFSLLLALQICMSLLGASYIVDFFDQQNRCLAQAKELLGENGVYLRGRMQNEAPLPDNELVGKLKSVDKVIKQGDTRATVGGLRCEAMFFNDDYYFEHSKSQLKKGRYPIQNTDESTVEFVGSEEKFTLNQSYVGWFMGKNVTFVAVGILRKNAQYVDFSGGAYPMAAEAMFDSIVEDGNGEKIFTEPPLADSDFMSTANNTLIVFREDISAQDRFDNMTVLNSARISSDYATVLKDTKRLSDLAMSTLMPFCIIFLVATVAGVLVASFLNYYNNEKMYKIIDVIGASKHKSELLQMLTLGIIFGVGVVLFGIVYAILNAVGLFKMIYGIVDVGFDGFNVLTILGLLAVFLLLNFVSVKIFDKIKKGRN